MTKENGTKMGVRKITLTKHDTVVIDWNRSNKIVLKKIKFVKYNC